VWQQGFDFRATSNYVADPPASTYVLPNTAYPTVANGVTFGWANTAPVAARDRSTTVDPRLAGMDYVSNGTPAAFYVDLPAPGTFKLALAMGDAGYPQCWTRCQVQFFDGNAVVGTVTGGPTALGYFYDATGKSWSATTWPGSNTSLVVTMSGTRLTVVVGTNTIAGDITPIAFLGVTQATTVPNFTVSAQPTALSVVQGSQGTSTITTTISGGFNSSISLSAAGVPNGTTVGFNPNPIGAPGAGSSTMTIVVGNDTAPGTYPITVTGDGGGIQQHATLTLTVAAFMQPDFTIVASPNSLVVGQGSQAISTIATSIQGSFSSGISLSATGVPSGTTVTFNPNPIAAPGAGSSTMTVTVRGSTALGTYPITVTATGGGKQHNTTVTLTVTTAFWQQGFDFRSTVGYVTDPPSSTYVLRSTAYPTKTNGVTFGWGNTSLVSGSDRSTMVDPRLAGINYVSNGTPAKFYVDLPAPGTYKLALAMGDAGYPQCWTLCQVQFFDGDTLLATVSGGQIGLGYFYDASGRSWPASAWPTNNMVIPVTLAGSQLTMMVGTSSKSGDLTPTAYLGVIQVSGIPFFSLSSSPSSLTVAQATQGTSTITSTITQGFNSAVTLSAKGVPTGTTVAFSPNPIAAPGAGGSTMTISVGGGTAVGTYPITITGTGGGVRQITTVTLTVVAGVQPDFDLAIAPGALDVAQSTKGTATVYTRTVRGFNNAVTLSASGVPTGATVSFNPNPIPAPGLLHPRGSQSNE